MGVVTTGAIDVTTVRVTLVAEPTEPACGCDSPDVEWSDVFGSSPRRAYWRCTSCGIAGALFFPAGDRINSGGRSAEVDRVLETVGASDGALGMLVRASEDVLVSRNRTREVDLVRFPDEVIDVLKRTIELRLQAWEAKQREIEREHRRRMFDLESALSRKIEIRKVRTRSQLARRPAPPDSAYRTLICGSDQCTAVIYGLVDPNEPERVRYVGQATNPAARLAGHITASRRDSTRKDKWIRDLEDQGRYPDMVLLERPKPGANLTALEEWWIVSMRDKGQGDLNTSLPSGRRQFEREAASV